VSNSDTTIWKRKIVPEHYDRMNPDFTTLLGILQTYVQIDYITGAYPLSVAEAMLIISYLQHTEKVAKKEQDDSQYNGN